MDTTRGSRQVASQTKYTVLLVICGCCLTVCATKIHRTESPFARQKWSSNLEYKTLEFEVPVDHFSFANQDRFKLRYLVADQFWDPSNGPVFFYTGNEGDITWFCNNTGFMWDIAPEFKAMLVFAEHRYYGKSMPYGEDSYKNPAHLGYLSSEQALADFADLIAYLRASRPGLRTTAFIAFGGSYGGMLSAWIRMKYPDAIQGALAASAPVWYFGDLTPCGAYYRITTQDFAREGAGCPENIRRSWSVITAMGKTASGRATLTRLLRLCKPLKDEYSVTLLKEWLTETYGNMAMVDYPYSANFLQPLPPWPIKVACGHLQQELEGDKLVAGVADVMGVYYNSTGKTQCFNTTATATTSLDDMGWDFQACSEMVMPLCSNGETDMFEASPWNLTAYSASCQARWGVRPRPASQLVRYGGRDIMAASNIIFSNGKLDPWSAAGVKTTLSESLVAIVIAEGAHHLDLRGANPADPKCVLVARQREKDLIKRWIADYNRGDRSEDYDTESVIITIHTTSSTHAAVFGVFSLFLVTCAGLLIVMVRRPTTIKVANGSASPMWMEVVDPGAAGLGFASNDRMKTSEKIPLLL